MTTPQRDVITILEEVAANGGSGQDALDAVNAHLATIETRVTSIDTHAASIDTHATSIDTKLSSQATAAKQDTGNTSLASLDGKLPTAAATSDDEANATTVTRVAARLEGFDGSTWDRIRTGITAVGNAVSGFINQIPWAFYHTTPTTRANGDGGPLETASDGSLYIVTRDRSGDAFSFGAWRGTVGGSALTADASDPNASAPLANQIVRVGNCAARGALMATGLGQLRLIASGGTSIVCQPWLFDTTQNTWIKYGPALTITIATTNLATPAFTVGGLVGAKFFVQITSNTGVTALGYEIA